MTAAAETSPRARLDVRAIVKSYGGTRVLHECSIEVGRGEVVALVGHNGAGKSTLSKIISGYERPDSGELAIDGAEYDVTTPKEALGRGVALVPQQLAVISTMTVAQNLMLGLRTSSGDVEAVAERLGLQQLLGSRIERLGPAAQRLVMIGRSLLRRPSLLILDEPTAAFSAAETKALFAIIEDLTADGMGIIYVSHRLREILDVADRVIGMSQGRVIADIPTSGVSVDDLADIIAGGADAQLGGDVADDLSFVAPDRGGEPGRVVLQIDDLATAAKVRSVSLAVCAGEVVGLTGLVGAGRSSLLHAVWGTGERVSGGSIQICGREFSPSTPRRVMDRGLVLVPENRQRTSLVPGMTVRENVALPTSRTRRRKWSPVLDKRREREAVNALLAELDTQPKGAVDMEIGSLSGGNQQKSVLARWLMVPSEVVVLDEPCEGVDIRARREIHAVLRALAEGGKGVLVSSSDVEELVEATDRILVMRQGVIVDELAGARKTVEAVNRACL